MRTAFGIGIILFTLGSSVAAQSIRVFVTDSASRTAEIIEAVNRRCPRVAVSESPRQASFVVQVDRVIAAGLQEEDNEVKISNPSGDVIYSNSADTLERTADNVCGAILDWVDERGIPQALEDTASGEESAPSQPSPFADVEWGPNGEGASREMAEAAWPEPEAPMGVREEASQRDQPSQEKPVQEPAKPAQRPAAQSRSGDQAQEEEGDSAAEEEDAEAKEYWENMVEGGIVILLGALGLVSLVTAIVATVKKSWSDLAFSLIGFAVVSIALVALIYKPDVLAWLEYLGSLI
ncbi:MAG TPA: hypothetical protein VLU25_10140 [Acidobacteriota bacterium]|nr:hypothetical protein [Acidobacteriota bacterium]